MRAVILAGGDIRPTPSLKAAVQAAGLVVAADSGLRHAMPLGVEPDIIVGDFDSVDEAELARYPHLPRRQHPPEKDWLDLELALDYVREEDAREVLIAGGLGGRFDQSLAAVLIAARLKREGLAVRLDSGDRQLYPLADGDALELHLPPGQRFSLLSLSPESVISVMGARYPLTQHTLAFGVGLGLSNEAADAPVKLELHQGLLAMIVE